MRIPNKRDIRIGERRQNISGDWMEIIEYRNQGDLDVRFDNGGGIVRHRKYDGFKNGKIRNPNYQERQKIRQQEKEIKRKQKKERKELLRKQERAERKEQKLKEKEELRLKREYERTHKHLGETVINNQGLLTTLIKWRNQNDIDVQFEDGTIVEGKTYKSFKKHCICNPNYSNSKTISRNEFCFYYYLKDFGFKHYGQGELKQYGLGQYTVDLFNPELLVAIEYDGRFHRAEKDHRKNQAFTEHGISMIRIREPEADELNDGLSKNFKIANANNFDPALTRVINEVIVYLNSQYQLNIPYPIDVIKDRDSILEKYFNETDYRLRNRRIGERTQNNQGLWVEIVDYRSKTDIDVKFDIDGLILKHCTCKQFRDKELPHPKYNRQYFHRQERLGEINKNISGYEMKIVEYRNSKDIDVLFIEDNLIVEHADYYKFQHGEIKRPSEKIDRTGEVVVNKQGQKMKIIRWGGKKDIDVEFEDGTIAYHREYWNFKSGRLTSRFYKNLSKNRVGEKHKTQKGLWIEIIEYRSSRDVDIRFDIDGTVLKHRSYSQIKEGKIRHPERIDLIGKTNINVDGYEMQLIKYRSAYDVDVLFTDDNSIVSNIQYVYFRNGQVKHP